MFCRNYSSQGDRLNNHQAPVRKVRAIAQSFSIAASVAAVLWVAPAQATERHSTTSGESAKSISLDAGENPVLAAGAEGTALAEPREALKFSFGTFQSDSLQPSPVPTLTAAAQIGSDVPAEPPALEPPPLASAQVLIEAGREEALDLAQDPLDSPENEIEPVDLPELEPADLPEGDVEPGEPVEVFPADPEVSDQPESGDRWQFSLEPYFFVPFDVSADVTVAGRSASLQAGLEDILNLDKAFDGGLRFEARNQRFGLRLEGFYLVAGQSGTLGADFPAGALTRFGIPIPVRGKADASVSVRQGTIDLAAFYRVVDTPLRRSATVDNPYPRLVIDPLLGIRTNILRQELEIDEVRIDPSPLPIPPTTLSLNQEFTYSRTTLEPLVGARIELDLSPLWSLGLEGDVSGFNVNAERDITWNLRAGARYYLSRSAAIQLAYGFSGFDFEDGEGLRRVEVDLTQHGLWLSALFRF